MTIVSTEPTFYWQTDLGLLGESLSLVCPRCFLTFDVPSDWMRSNAHTHVGCPNCHLSSVIPEIPA